MPWELVLKGTNLTLLHHLSYQILTEQNPSKPFEVLQDHHWRLMATWMTNKWAAELGPKLDDVVYVATSCLDPLPKVGRLEVALWCKTLATSPSSHLNSDYLPSCLASPRLIPPHPN